MTRKVFFSFQYEDVQRAMNVRNSNVIASDTKVGFIDKADFEEVERKGDSAIKKWINSALRYERHCSSYWSHNRQEQMGKVRD